MTLTVVVVLATTAVVVALNRLDDGEAVAERCTARVGELAWYLTPTQADNAALIAATSLRRDLPARAATIAIATALQESRLENIDYGDRDSIGLFQQRPSQGWGTVEQIMDPVYSTDAFYDVLITVEGYQELPVTQAAQKVQRSAFPDAYAQHEDKSRAWASALTGYSPATLTCELGSVSAVEAALGTAPITDRIARDLGDLPVDAPGSIVDVDARSLVPEENARAAWAVAQWAVAVADSTGVDAVQVGDRRWSRSKATWKATDDQVPAGHVRIEIAPTPTG